MSDLARKVRSLHRGQFVLVVCLLLVTVAFGGYAVVTNQRLDTAQGDRAVLREAFNEANDRLVDEGLKPVEPPVAGEPGAAGTQGARGPRGRPGADGRDGKPGPRGADGSEKQQSETQDPERQNVEPDDPDPNDPEAQDPEIQDPEVDDPDPNSALDFRVDDQCTPPDGTVVTDVNLVIERSPGVVTFILRCTAADPPGPVTTP